jgi:PiT family inorganic phosphate transporter
MQQIFGYGADRAAPRSPCFHNIKVDRRTTVSGQPVGAIGVGAAKKVSAVRWGVAKGIVTARIITIPASAAVAALIYGLGGLFG